MATPSAADIARMERELLEAKIKEAKAQKEAADRAAEEEAAEERRRERRESKKRDAPAAPAPQMRKPVVVVPTRSSGTTSKPAPRPTKAKAASGGGKRGRDSPETPRTAPAKKKVRNAYRLGTSLTCPIVCTEPHRGVRRLGRLDRGVGPRPAPSRPVDRAVQDVHQEGSGVHRQGRGRPARLRPVPGEEAGVRRPPARRKGRQGEEGGPRRVGRGDRLGRRRHRDQRARPRYVRTDTPLTAG